MRILFTCLALDEDHPILSHVTGWVRTLSDTEGVEEIVVVSPNVGRFDASDRVRVRSIGRGGRLSTLRAFYKEVFAARRHGIDAFFVCQGGPYPALLLPFRLLTGTPIFQWKAHALVSVVEKFYARFCDTRLFTATESSFPVPVATRRIVGHGIDTGMFGPVAAARVDGLVTVGRVTPVKKMERMIDLVASIRERTGRILSLHVYGPTGDADEPYRRGLQEQAAALGLADNIVFHGPVPRSRMPEILSGHRVFLHFCIGALDKAALEAMACGIPVVSDNPCVAEALPPSLRDMLYAGSGELDDAADRVVNLLEMPNEDYDRLGVALRDNVETNHSVDRLFREIVTEMRAAGVR